MCTCRWGKLCDVAVSLKEEMDAAKTWKEWHQAMMAYRIHVEAAAPRITLVDDYGVPHVIPKTTLHAYTKGEQK